MTAIVIIKVIIKMIIIMIMIIINYSYYFAEILGQFSH